MSKGTNFPFFVPQGVWLQVQHFTAVQWPVAKKWTGWTKTNAERQTLLLGVTVPTGWAPSLLWFDLVTLGFNLVGLSGLLLQGGSGAGGQGCHNYQIAG